MPLVSVIVPAKNAGARIAESLASAIGQTHADVEIIVVDDGSTDGSIPRAAELLETSGRPYRIVEGGGQGVSHARNVGLAAARGDFVQWLDADDEIAATKIARQLDALDGDDAVAVSDFALVAAEAQKPTIKVLPVVLSSDPLLDFLLGLAPQIGAFLFPRALADRLHALGVFDEATAIGEDREYVTLAALLGARFVHVPHVSLMYYVWSDKQVSRKTKARAWSHALETIHARLRKHAGVPLTDDHRWALAQDWRLYTWRVRDVVASPWWQPTARLLNGRDVELSILEAAIVKARDESAEPATLERIARAMCEESPELGYRLVDVRRALDGLVKRGALVVSK